MTSLKCDAKKCVVEVPFNLYCTVNVCFKFTASKQVKYLLMDKQYHTMGIPENLGLLIPFVQNLTSTFSILSEFSF